MKNCLTILSVLLVFCGMTQAQARLIPRVGWQNYYVTEERAIDMDGQTGIHAGVDLRFGSDTYLQPGIFYYNQHADLRRITGGNIDSRIEELDFSMLRLPLVFGTSFLEVEKFAMRAQVGGVANLPLDVKDNLFTLQKEDLEDVSFGATIGFGLDIDRVTFDINYDFGLTDTWVERTVQVENTSFGLGGKSNMLLFSLGFKIGGR